MTTAQHAPGQLYLRALEATAGIVNGVRPEQWHDPTPCSEWDVRALVHHLTYENFWAAELFAGKTMEEIGARYELNDLLGEDPLKTFNESVEGARKTAQEPGVMERTVHLSMGDTTGAEYAKQMFMDQLVHGWDVAKATGQDTRLDPELVDECVPFAEKTVAEYGQYGIFGTPVEVQAEAGRQSQLLAIVGRQG